LTGMSCTEEDWQERLDNILSTPDKKNVNTFIASDVKKAFEKVKKQFDANDIQATISTTPTGILLIVSHGDEHDFCYGIHKKQHAQPDFNTDGENDSETYYRAEVHLAEGGQDYDVMGWSEDSVINDIIDQYQKHLHFLHVLRD
ncbi:MAG: choline transporter, partial [Psychrobium sp.]